MLTSRDSLPTDSLAIYRMVSEVLQDSLAVELGEVHLGAYLIRDLGADDVTDFLDIAVRLERALGVICGEDVFPFKLGLDFGKHLHSRLTDSILEKIREAMPPDLPLPELQPGQVMTQDLFTVRFLCQAMAHKLNVSWADLADPSL